MFQIDGYPYFTHEQGIDDAHTLQVCAQIKQHQQLLMRYTHAKRGDHLRMAQCLFEVRRL